MADEPPTPQRLRFSIRGVLLVTALCAVAAAPAGWLGGLYSASATASLVLLAVVTRALATGRTVEAFVACVIGVFASALLFSSGLFLQSASTLVLCLLCLVLPAWRRPLGWACVAAMLCAYVPTLSHAIRSDQRVDRLREEWPLVSIRDRLPSAASTADVTPVSLSADQDKAIRKRDKEVDGSGYLWNSLRRLHRDSYKRFARSPGFGFARVGPVTDERLAWGDELRRRNENTPVPVRLSKRANDADPSGLHHATQVAFLQGDRVGYVESIERVAGFLGHGFGDLPHDGYRDADEPRTGDWRLNRLDLIGLVLNDEPVAYVSETLPNMEELPEAATRSLDEFETKAIETFAGQEDLVIEESITEGETNVRMVGAIRAGESCAACHEVPHGTLLGAFSYGLTRRVAAESLAHELESER